jgi:hypothetical protein
MWWIVGGVLLVWVVCAIPIAILFGRAIARRDRAEFESRNQAWADRTAASFEADASSERPQNDRRNPPLIG